MSLLTQHSSMTIRKTERWRLMQVLERALDEREHLARASARIFARNRCMQRFLRSDWILSNMSEQRSTDLIDITNMNSSEQSTLFIISDHQRKINFVKQKVKFTRHAVSQSQSTHAFLHVHLFSHFAAVHLIIHSFHVQEHQEQIFFSSFYDYFLCCTHLKSVITSSLIVKYVQIIYNIYYQSEQWDFSSKISYVLKKHEDCISL